MQLADPAVEALVSSAEAATATPVTKTAF